MLRESQPRPTRRQATAEELQQHAGASPRAESPAGAEVGEEGSAAVRMQASYRGKARA